MDFLERRKTVVVDHEIVVNGVVHKERKEVTTITPLCDSCHSYEGGKCPCPEAKGPLQTVRKHECHIGNDFVQVTEVSSDDEVKQAKLLSFDTRKSLSIFFSGCRQVRDHFICGKGRD